MLLYACAIKSLTVLSFTWLPDAMEGPTPVSTLLHSATLVLAGLIVYTHYAHVLAVTPLILVLTIGYTCVCTSWCIDADAKKVCAISTALTIALL